MRGLPSALTGGGVLLRGRAHCRDCCGRDRSSSRMIETASAHRKDYAQRKARRIIRIDKQCKRSPSLDPAYVRPGSSVARSGPRPRSRRPSIDMRLLAQRTSIVCHGFAVRSPADHRPICLVRPCSSCNGLMHAGRSSRSLGSLIVRGRALFPSCTHGPFCVRWICSGLNCAVPFLHTDLLAMYTRLQANCL